MPDPIWVRLLESYDSGLRIGYDAEVVGVDLMYPRLEGHPKAVEVGLEDVRSADDVRISYDFDRDGWKIEQPVWTEEDRTGDEWREAAFLPAWAFDSKPDDQVGA